MALTISSQVVARVQSSAAPISTRSGATTTSLTSEKHPPGDIPIPRRNPTAGSVTPRFRARARLGPLTTAMAKTPPLDHPMAPIRPGFTNGRAWRYRSAPKASSKRSVFSTSGVPLEQFSTMPRGVQLSTTSATYPRSFSHFAQRACSGSTPPHPWRRTIAGNGPGSSGR